MISSQAKGVFYLCQRCTTCCRWPGDVRISDADVGAMARHLDLGEDEFLARFTRLRHDRSGLSLTEKTNHECIMLEDGGCRVHPVKPLQCKGFPNDWNYPGWELECHAIPLMVPVKG